MNDDRNRTRYFFSALFILIGLMLCLTGTYLCLVDKYYEGKIENFEIEAEIEGSPIPMLKDEYPYNIDNIGSTFYYCFHKRSFKALEGLSYTMDTKSLWYTVVGLPFLILGICAIVRKDLLFK